MNCIERMLVVDDDVAFCQIVTRHLHRRGVQVRAVHDAKSALREAIEFKPTAILLDLKLGQDNGLRLIGQLRQTCEQARIVLATGFASIATAVDAIRRGAWNYLPKPFDVESLLRAFEQAPDELELSELPAMPHSLRRLNWEHEQRVLAEYGGNVSAAARALGLDRRTLQRRLAKRPVREHS